MRTRRPTRVLIPVAGAPRPKRGVAVVLVLGLLAVTLAVSYATLRGQGITTQLARNHSRALDAREAARSGLAAALRKMSENAWEGVGTPISANVSDHVWYEATFSTGDSQLTPTDPLYGEYPYRVTITATGYAADPANVSVRAVHRCRSVVQLVRTALLPPPANWNDLTNFTLYQWGNRNVQIQPPVRVDGPANVLGRALVALEYPLTTASRERYLSDLNAMRQAGLPDYRPFQSPLTIALARQDATNLALLTTRLGLTTVDTLAATTNPLSHPGSVTSYRLYPGGLEYTPPVLQDLYGSTLQDLTLAPDPVTNPLGVFRSRGSLSIQNNVRLTGTLVTNDSSPEVQIYGTNVVLQAFDLPKLYGSNQVYQLPAALVRDDLRVNPAAEAQIKGFTMVWDEFELKRGSPTTRFALEGNLVTCGMLLRGRDTWTMNATEWGTWLSSFNANLLLATNDPNREAYFPAFMQKMKGFTVQPALTFKPASSGVRPHWHDWTQPVYQPGTNDPGLRWEVIRTEDGL